MNDVGLDTARSQPAGEPEAVTAGLEGDGDASDLVPCLLRFRSPALEQLQEFVLVGCELLQRLALHARYDPGYEPCLFAEFDHGGQSLVRFERCKGTAQVVERLLLLIRL